MIVALTEGEEYVLAQLQLTFSETGKKSDLEIVDLIELVSLLMQSHALARLVELFLPLLGMGLTVLTISNLILLSIASMVLAFIDSANL